MPFLKVPNLTWSFVYHTVCYLLVRPPECLCLLSVSWLSQEKIEVCSSDEPLHFLLPPPAHPSLQALLSEQLGVMLWATAFRVVGCRRSFMQEVKVGAVLLWSGEGLSCGRRVAYLSLMMKKLNCKILFFWLILNFFKKSWNRYKESDWFKGWRCSNKHMKQRLNLQGITFLFLAESV